jgi:ankyrin repeat protein
MNRIEQELIDAAIENNLPEVSRLLSVGADVNAKDRRARTPLHWASLRGHVQVFKELLDHGADIDATNNRDRTPLCFACANGHVSIVTELLSRGANTEAKDIGDGKTPLHDASGRGHLLVVKALLSGGADTLAASNYGQLPIHYAVIHEKSDVSKYLFQQLYATTRHLPLHDLVEDLTWIGDSYI